MRISTHSELSLETTHSKYHNYQIFKAKQRFGTGDAFGELGNEKLRFARGENFKKEKGKLKNR